MAVCEICRRRPVWQKLTGGLNIYTPSELEGLFAGAGFENIRADVSGMGWLCMTGFKPPRAENESAFAESC